MSSAEALVAVILSDGAAGGNSAVAPPRAQGPANLVPSLSSAVEEGLGSSRMPDSTKTSEVALLFDHHSSNSSPQSGQSDRIDSPADDAISRDKVPHSANPCGSQEAVISGAVEHPRFPLPPVTASDNTGYNHVGGCVTFPVTVDFTDVRSDIGMEILETEAPAPRRPIFNGRLFSLKNNKARSRPTGGNFGGRTYDYKVKYDEDEWGYEMQGESRFYRTYVDVCDIYDLERMEGWRDVLDVLLVFIGLFSAIVTTFVVQTSQSLQPDYGQVTAMMVYNLILVQQSIANGNSTVPIIENPMNTRAAPSGVEQWVNGLWFTSLAISLSTALITVLTKQWLYHYMAQTSGSSQERARLRQFRFAGLERYRVAMIIDLLPVALHLSLALFLAGLALYLSVLNIPIAAVVGIISGLAYLAYAISTLLPLYDPQCPYQSPISSYLHHLKALLPSFNRIRVWVLERRIQYLQLWFAVQTRISRLSRRNLPTEDLTEDLTEELYRRLGDFRHLPPPPSTLELSERHSVSNNCHQLDIDSITWLYSTSSNPTVRDISFQAVVGLTPSYADTTLLCRAIDPYYRSLRNSNPGSESFPYIMQARCVDGFDVWIPYWIPTNVEPEETDARTVFKHVVLRALSTFHDYTLDMSSFLAAGPRANTRLPLSVWRLCIPSISEHLSDPIVMSSFIRECLPQEEEGHCPAPATFAGAVKYNHRLRSLFQDTLLQHFGLTREGDLTSPFGYGPILPKIIDWAYEYLDLHPQSDHSGPAKVALTLLKACHGMPVLHFSLETCVKTRDACNRVLDCLLEHEVTEEAWGVYYELTQLLSRVLSPPNPPICPPPLFISLLNHLHRPPPLGTNPDEIARSLDPIPNLLWTACNPEILYNILREQDVLPLPLARSGGDQSYHSQFWGWWMCRCAALSQMWDDVDISADWMVMWVGYIDCPERLFFLLRQGVLEDRVSGIPLFERARRLLNLTRNSSHWATSFEWIIDLLGDEEYINSIEGYDNPRHQLSNLLLHMKQNIPCLDQSQHHIPRYDKNDNLISDSDTLNTTVPVHPTSTDPDPVIRSLSLSGSGSPPIHLPAASSSRFRSKLKAVLRFSNTSRWNEQTPKAPEDGDEGGGEKRHRYEDQV